jgi:signal transduction histidine kinase
VRPATRELARSPLFARDEPTMGESTPLSLIKGRMDVTQAIKPWWWLAVSWGVLIPGPLILGAQISVILQWMAVSLIAVLLFLVVKAVWPRRLRNMPIPLGLGVLLILYSLTSVGFEYLASQVLPRIASAETWASNNLAGSIIRISLCMLVSILATLDVHGRQTRATLLETNIELEELIARIKRETWLLHRSVSLAVHGTVQSALISTAMRLSAPNRTHEIVEDARRRLEDALTSISVDQHEDSSVVSALEDLQGLWEPMVTIDFEISDSARVRLVEDSGLRRCVIEICREAVSNAIRHGHSISVSLVIDVSDELLRIRVTDDGKSSNLDSPAGLGSQMLDETCLRWSRVRRPGDGSELVALLA